MAIPIPQNLDEDRALLTKLKDSAGPRKGPYYGEKTARDLRDFLLDWRERGYPETLIQQSVMGITKGAIKNKLHNGRDFIIDHAEQVCPDPEQRLIILEVVGNVVFSNHPDGMLVQYRPNYKANDLIFAASYATTQNVQPAVDLRAEFQAWVEGNPKAGETFSRDGIRINDADREWFTQQRAMLHPAGILIQLMATKVSAKKVVV